MFYRTLFGFLALSIITLLSIGIISSKVMLIIIFLFFPTFTAVLFDKSQDKCLSLCVGLFNISAVLLYSPSVIRSLDVLFITQIFTSEMIFFVYSNSFIGVILYLIVPHLIKFLNELVIQVKKNKLQTKIDNLVNKWEL